jgi:hypothetical protein
MSSSAAAIDSNTGKFFGSIKSMHEFDKAEVKSVIGMLLPPMTTREQCFIGTYYRTLGNVESLLLLDGPKHFQAIAMLARALFELAVDIRLLDVIPVGWEKMAAFINVEKLRAANKVLTFKKENPTVEFDSVHEEFFVTHNTRVVEDLKNFYWPAQKNVSHWSGLRLSERASKLGPPFDRIYAVDYSKLSWYAHPGLTGVAYVPPEGLTNLCGYALHMATTAYGESILAMVREFKISAVTDGIDDLLKLAKMLPFTDSPEQAEELIKILAPNKVRRQ